MGPEKSSFVEKNVETEVRRERDQAEDEGDQEEDTWTDSKVRVKKIFHHYHFYLSSNTPQENQTFS